MEHLVPYATVCKRLWGKRLHTHTLVNDLPQSTHLLPHLRAHPPHRELRTLSLLFSRWRSSSFPPPSRRNYIRDAVTTIPSRLEIGQNGGKKSTVSKMIGFVWVFVSFTYCMPIWLGPQVHAGTVDERRHFSLIRVLSARF